MRPLSDADCLDLWGGCAALHPAARALRILACALPELPAERLPELGLGSVQAALLGLYARSFGAELTGLADCPRCGATVEMTLPVEALIVAPFDPDPPTPRQIGASGYEITFRPATSSDLLAAARAPSERAAREVLLRRAVLAVRRDGEEVADWRLPDEAVEALAEAMSEVDPQAELLLELRCAECEGGWSTTLDVGEHLWREVRRVAEHLTWEIHHLARSYGWSEREVLSLPPHRRRRYLDLVGA